jgi:hypothetical protein
MPHAPAAAAETTPRKRFGIRIVAVRVLAILIGAAIMTGVLVAGASSALAQPCRSCVDTDPPPPAPPKVSPPAAPTGMHVDHIDSDYIYFQWQDNATNETAYTLHWREIPPYWADWPPTTGSATINLPNFTSTRLALSRFNVDEYYDFWVSADNAGGSTPMAGTLHIIPKPSPPRTPPPPAAPNVTGLAGITVGTSIVWTWQGNAADTNYTVTLSDPSLWLIWSPQNVNGGRTGTISFRSDNLQVGHTYHLLVVTHRSGNSDSSGTGTSVTIPQNPPPGVRDVDLYNCSARGNRTIWMSNNGGDWTSQGIAQDSGFGTSCGPGASTPLSISLPAGLITLEATNDGSAPRGVDNVTYTQVFIGATDGQTVQTILST